MKKICYIIIAMLMLAGNMAFAQAPGGAGGMGPGGGQRPDGAGMGMPPGGGKGGPQGKDPKNAPSKKQKKQKTPDQIVNANGMFIFGIAYNPTDSVVYLTDELILDNAQIYKKTKFLVNREDYSEQLKTYMEGKGEPNRTCAVTYAKTIKALDKKYKKQVAYLKKRGFLIQHADQTEFRFTTVRNDQE